MKTQFHLNENSMAGKPEANKPPLKEEFLRKKKRLRDSNPTISNTKEEIEAICLELVSKVLNLAELALEENKFRAFKKEVLGHFHSELKGRLSKVFENDSQIGAVPIKDKMAGNGVYT